MHDEILLQPAYVRRLVAGGAALEGVAAALSGRRRVFLTGCGTSLHAAVAGEGIARWIWRGACRVRAVAAFELVHHPWDLGPDDALVVVSHSGETPLVLDALRRAREAGAFCAAVTGFRSSPAAELADEVVPTGYAEERSFAHTISYSLSAAALLLLFGLLAGGERLDDARRAVQRMASALPDAVSAAVAAEAPVAALARDLQDRRLWVVAGTGTGLAVAQEAALKAAETHSTPAVGLDIEQVLHGYLPMCGPDSLLIVAAPPRRVRERVDGLLRAALRIGTRALIVAEPDGAGVAGAEIVPLPPCHEALAPIVAAVPLHLLSYHVAIAKGLDPDLIRRDDAAYRDARACYA